MNILDAIEDHEKNCIDKLTKIFVPWFWMAWVFVILASGVVGASWIVSERIAKVERSLAQYEIMVNKINYIADHIDRVLKKDIR